MATGSKQPSGARSAAIEVAQGGEVALVHVKGLIDEHFTGLGDLGAPVTLIVDVSGMVRMTSFGVRQWRRALDALPKSVNNLYLLGCPTFFVDQLNMVVNFGGNAEIITVMAPYACTACGAESAELIDVLAQRALLLKAGVPEKDCARCGGKLELDEAPESYFGFVGRYGAQTLDAGAAELLAATGLYQHVGAAPADDKPPKIIKLVQGTVTYFRIIGQIGSMFRARPLLVGAEGEIVIDLAEVDRVDPGGVREWQRLLSRLCAQVPAVTIVDVGEALLTTAPTSLTQARNISVWSMLVPYRCADCGRTRLDSQRLGDMTWPYTFADQVCPTCGGTSTSIASAHALAPLQKVASHSPPESAKLIPRRNEVLSRALTDANVAQAGDTSGAISTEETILGKYKIVRRLSSGGMAEVFLAKQIGIGGFEKPVALKRIQRKLLEKRHLAIDMFLNEAKIVGRLAHPNIVQVLDVGQVGGELYLAMEYVHGRDLREIIKWLNAQSVKVPLNVACYIVREVAQALHHAYWSTDLEGKQLSVVHRDVSPHNVILGYDGTVKLLDFGVAMSAVTEQEAMIVGKWIYMSPEATANKAVDHRSDLFSLGIITYLMCTGALPFSGTDPKDIVKKIRVGQYKPAVALEPGLPPELVTLIDRLLSSTPEARPQTGLDVVATLNEIMRKYMLESSAVDIADMVAQFDAGKVESSGTHSTSPISRLSGSYLSRTSGRFRTPSMPPEASKPPMQESHTETGTKTTVDPPRGEQTHPGMVPEAIESRDPPSPSLRPRGGNLALWAVASAVLLLIVYALVKALH